MTRWLDSIQFTGVDVPVEIDVKAPTEVMGDGVNHDIKYRRRKNSVSANKREERLSLSA